MFICSTEQKPSSAISIFPYQAFSFQFQQILQHTFPAEQTAAGKIMIAQIR
jgi:hypothetical protein